MDPSIVGLIMVAFLSAILIGLVLFIIIKLVVGNFERKNLVDVDVYSFCGGNIDRRGFNCSVKQKTLSNIGNFILKPFPFGKEEFEYLPEFVISRAKDRKRVINFINIRGKLIPFLPGYKVVEESDKKFKAETFIDLKSYTPEILDRRIEELLIEGDEKYKDVGKKKQGLAWQIIIAGILLLGGAVYFIMKYAK